MSTVSLRIPDSLHARARELAEQENISLNQLITLALSEKVSSLLTQDYLAQRAERASRERFLQALDKVPDVPADAEDRL